MEKCHKFILVIYHNNSVVKNKYYYNFDELLKDFQKIDFEKNNYSYLIFKEMELKEILKNAISDEEVNNLISMLEDVKNLLKEVK